MGRISYRLIQSTYVTTEVLCLGSKFTIDDNIKFLQKLPRR